jgi:transposase-like protein
MIPEAKRAQIIKALKANPNANAVAREIGDVSAPTVCKLAKKANIALGKGGPKKFSAEKRAQIIKALKANPNASAVAREIGGVGCWVVARLAKKANIELVAGKAAWGGPKLRKNTPAAPSLPASPRRRQEPSSHRASRAGDQFKDRPARRSP